MEFERRLHEAAQRLIPPQANSGYPPLVVMYMRHPPVLLDDQGATIQPPRPDPRFVTAARRLGPLVDFIVITSNGAHVFAPEVEQESGRPVLSMVALVLEEVRRRSWKGVGLIGMGRPAVYMASLDESGVRHEILDDERIKALDAGLLRVMAGIATETDAALAKGAVADLLSRGVDGVVLGCTELPFLVLPAADSPNLIDPIGLLAEAAVRRAMDTYGVARSG
jgi:aspartate racemase